MSFSETTQKARALFMTENEVTTHTAISLLACFVSVFVGLLIAWVGMANSWTCALDSVDPVYSGLCTELQSFMGCTKISGPVRAEVRLTIENTVQASAFLVCPWDTALSEVKVCVYLTALLGIWLGLKALSHESKKEAEFYIQISYFFSFLLAAGSLFDFFALSSAESNNQDVCTLSGTFEVKESIQTDQLECYYWVFSLTGYYGLFCSVLVLVSSFYMQDWKRTASDIEF